MWKMCKDPHTQFRMLNILLADSADLNLIGRDSFQCIKDIFYPSSSFSSFSSFSSKWNQTKSALFHCFNLSDFNWFICNIFLFLFFFLYLKFRRYGRWVTRRIAVLTIVGIWLLAALVSFVPISFGLHRPDQPFVIEDNGRKYPTCALDLTPTYAVVSSCISFYVPCIVMIGIYCR